jgi:hypothetical protein
MENTRENVIKKISHTREWIAEEFLFQLEGNVHNIDHMVRILKEWIDVANPWTEFCDVPDCEGMWIRGPNGSSGMLSHSWKQCKKCKKQLCSNHRKTSCPHYLQDNTNTNKTNKINENGETKHIVIDDSINMLTRDVLTIILKHLIEIERKEIELYIIGKLQKNQKFKTFRQVIFTVNFELSENASEIDICDDCEAFLIYVYTVNRTNCKKYEYDCESIIQCNDKNSGSIVKYCNNCIQK